MFIQYPTNIDYLIQDVRLHIGDFNLDPTSRQRFSDSVIRTSLVSGIKMLQKRWANRYVVFTRSMVVDPLPSDVIYADAYDAAIANGDDISGYVYVVPESYVLIRIAEGYASVPEYYQDNYVIRNPYAVYNDRSHLVISQEDEYPVVLAGAITLRKSQLSSSADSFQSWSDGQFSFSNLGSQRALGELYATDMNSLDAYFKKKLSAPLRSGFGDV